MEPKTVKLRIRRWKNKPAFKERILWLTYRGEGQPHLIFKADDVHEIHVDSDALALVVDRACRGGGLELVEDDAEVTGGAKKRKKKAEPQIDEDDPLA